MKKTLILSIVAALLSSAFFPTIGFATYGDDTDLTGVSEIGTQLDEQGRTLTGKGIKIAIIDSGVDLSHPAFGGKKIVGYDFLTRKKHVIDECGHGTHITGLILQVSPDVSIYSYRVLDRYGEAEEGDHHVVEALKMAIHEHVDMINLSLGNGVLDQEVMKVIQRAIQNRIIVVTAAGNVGPKYGTIQLPAASPDVVTVGAITKKMAVPIIQLEGHVRRIEIIPLDDSPPVPLEGAYLLVDVGTGENDEDYKDVAGKVALVKRSDTSSQEISHKAHANGASAVLIYNHKKGEWNGEAAIRLVGEGPEYACAIPTAAIAGEYGTYLQKKGVNKGTCVRFASLQKERIDYASSRGPVLDNGDLKPDVVALGDIRSCVPSFLNETGYKEMSGTSQATAYVTGLLALLKQKYPAWSPEELKAVLMETADPLTNTLHKTIPYIDQGAGKVDIQKAISVKSLVLPSTLNFGTVLKKSGKNHLTKMVTLQNHSNMSKRYELKVQMVPKPRGVKVRVPSVVDVPANSEIQIEVTLFADSDKIKKGYHTGAIWVKDGEGALHIPFVISKKNH